MYTILQYHYYNIIWKSFSFHFIKIPNIFGIRVVAKYRVTITQQLDNSEYENVIINCWNIRLKSQEYFKYIFYIKRVSLTKSLGVPELHNTFKKVTIDWMTVHIDLQQRADWLKNHVDWCLGSLFCFVFEGEATPTEKHLLTWSR